METDYESKDRKSDGVRYQLERSKGIFKRKREMLEGNVWVLWCSGCGVMISGGASTTRKSY